MELVGAYLHDRRHHQLGVFLDKVKKVVERHEFRSVWLVHAWATWATIQTEKVNGLIVCSVFDPTTQTPNLSSLLFERVTPANPVFELLSRLCGPQIHQRHAHAAHQRGHPTKTATAFHALLDISALKQTKVEAGAGILSLFS